MLSSSPQTAKLCKKFDDRAERNTGGVLLNDESDKINYGLVKHEENTLACQKVPNIPQIKDIFHQMLQSDKTI